MKAMVLVLSLAGLIVRGNAPLPAPVQYPLDVTLDAQLKMGVTTITSKVTIHVDRPMSDAFRTRVTDALQHGGYSNFVTTLRPMPTLGSIATQSASVDIRYTREDQDTAGTRLVLVADRPLFLLTQDPTKVKPGFDLTTVELTFDGKGGVTGKMAGASRVRPAPDGGVLLDILTEDLVQLKGTLGKS